MLLFFILKWYATFDIRYIFVLKVLLYPFDNCLIKYI
jgi:hypothetical protein